MLTPGDSLWLAILNRDPELADLAVRCPEKLRRKLRKVGFPNNIVEEFIRRKSPEAV
jgi:hypothetical protein